MCCPLFNHIIHPKVENLFSNCLYFIYNTEKVFATNSLAKLIVAKKDSIDIIFVSCLPFFLV
ncbi:MAG: hypothetical protein A2Y57_02130 [Candidatus Woykebacteria bacterium RBG_13_40_7b]|uniref:Uncharacterized protein n=1 Tax=Candidatus Woykebacteria bacterium RBG_13_40_7b TaxID=1802594 RepID=A0A1G1WB77_9BACT|nr:MAG: hypothetical protein A2Y57_02130 [Candidatus Woykebacteria bacterium RBG_13_40_7b]